MNKYIHNIARQFQIPFKEIIQNKQAPLGSLPCWIVFVKKWGGF